MFKTTTRQVRVSLALESTVISNHRRRKIASFTELMFAVWYLLISVIEERYRQVKGLKTKKLKRKKGKTSCFILRNILTVISYLIYVSKHTSLYCFCKKASSQMFNRVLNTPLHLLIFSGKNYQLTFIVFCACTHKTAPKTNCRNSYLQMLFRIAVLRNFAIFTGKWLLLILQTSSKTSEDE